MIWFSSVPQASSGASTLTLPKPRTVRHAKTDRQYLICDAWEPTRKDRAEPTHVSHSSGPRLLKR